jgi:drug/metabolite transporter (DMT)-like permease
MKRRLYVVLPDLASAIQTANDLLLARVEDRHMHFLGRRGMSLGDLHEASYLQKSDVRHALFLGVGLGVIGGMLLGVYLRLSSPIGDFTADVGTFILCVLGGGLFGAWTSTLIGLSTPSMKLKQFEKEIEAGKILLMVDVPVSRLAEIEALLARRHPEAVDKGIDPTMPVFP